VPYFLSPRIHIRIGWIMISTVIVLSLAPMAPLPEVSGGYDDKIAHAIVYCVLMFWFGLVSVRAAWGRIACRFIAMGIALEICQSLLPYRTASAADVLANGIGIFIGCAATFALRSASDTGSSSQGRAK
jgi:VanZ family protein